MEPLGYSAVPRRHRFHVRLRRESAHRESRLCRQGNNHPPRAVNLSSQLWRKSNNHLTDAPLHSITSQVYVQKDEDTGDEHQSYRIYGGVCRCLL
jgi:hypothetical protein